MTSGQRSRGWRLIALTAICMLSFAVGAAVMLYVPPAGIPDEVEGAASAPEFIRANPKLAPDEVVRAQLASLQASRRDVTALQQCFALASRANREVTGPLPNFARIVRNREYQALVFADRATIGKPQVSGDQAMVVVTVIDPGHKTSVYRFFLSKQDTPPYVDCWMTDAVALDGVLEGPNRPRPSRDDTALHHPTRTRF